MFKSNEVWVFVSGYKFMHVWKWWSGSKEERKKEKERRRKKKNVGVGLKKKERKKNEKMPLVMWQCTGERAHWNNLFMGLPLSHISWVLKTVERCFQFPSSSLIFLSHRITKTKSPNKSHGVQIRCLPWAPSVLDHEWCEQDHITQNSLHPNMLLFINQFSGH